MRPNGGLSVYVPLWSSLWFMVHIYDVFSFYLPFIHTHLQGWTTEVMLLITSVGGCLNKFWPIADKGLFYLIVVERQYRLIRHYLVKDEGERSKVKVIGQTVNLEWVAGCMLKHIFSQCWFFAKFYNCHNMFKFLLRSCTRAMNQSDITKYKPCCIHVWINWRGNHFNLIIKYRKFSNRDLFEVRPCWLVFIVG